MIRVGGAHWLILKNEIKALIREPQRYCQPILVFVLVICLFPIGVSPDSAVLNKLAPGVIWIGVLLATILGLQDLFRDDWQSGYLDKCILSQHSLTLLVILKLIAHWLITILPLIIIAPLAGLFLQLQGPAILVLLVTLFLATPLLNLLGAMTVALTLGLQQQGMLLLILLLPLFVPILIFSSSAIGDANQGVSLSGQLYWLGAMTSASFAIGPWIVAGILKVGVAQ